MNISLFFTEVLGANLRNQRWSWGSYDPMTDRVFLRVWEDEIRRSGNTEIVRVHRSKPRRFSSGYAERDEHLELIRNGASGYGVLCTAVDSATSDARRIKSFDESTLLRFGMITEERDGSYAEIAGRVPVTELSRQRTSESTVADDLKSLIRKKIDSTTKDALVSARVGQGAFRAQVLELWDQRCSVTLAGTLDAIRASHIKPWRHSTNEERLDPHNGLPLIASLDALFDAGLISFGGRGELMVSGALPESERSIFGLKDRQLAKKPNDETFEYLSYHRAHVFRR